MDIKFAVSRRGSIKTYFYDSFERFIKVLRSLPEERYFTVVVVKNDSVYLYNYYSGNGDMRKSSDVLDFADFVDSIKKGEI